MDGLLSKEGMPLFMFRNGFMMLKVARSFALCVKKELMMSYVVTVHALIGGISFLYKSLNSSFET